MTDPVKLPRKRGCFFYGCLALTLVVLLLGALGYVGYRYTKSSINRLVNEYTDTTPLPVESVNISPTELSALQRRVAEFGEALKSGKSAEELILTPDEINALIANDPAFQEFKNKLFVIIDEDRIKGRISVPLDDIGPLKLKGRYLNGMATLNVAFQNGKLVVRVADIEVKGKPLPAPILAQFQQQDFAKGIQDDPESAEALRKFESIQVKDGRLILRNKGNK